MSCILDTENRIQTPVGEIIPQYRVAELGERQKKYRSSLGFFENGQIKTASLDRAMPLKTPLGIFEAELVTFYDNGAINLAGAFVLEVLLTGAFVLVILLVTERVAAPGFAGLAIGLALTVVHLVGIPLDGTSVNPARSFGPALFAGGNALSQVWLFILAPLVGAVVASLVWRVTRTEVDITPEDMIAGSERE